MIGNKAEITEYLEKQEDGMFEITKKQQKSIRSLAQNKYYWAIVVKIIRDYTGDSEISVHEMIKSMFKLKTTTDLSTSEFKWLIDQIIEMFANYGVIIPLPIDSGLEKSLMESLY